MDTDFRRDRASQVRWEGGAMGFSNSAAFSHAREERYFAVTCVRIRVAIRTYAGFRSRSTVFFAMVAQSSESSGTSDFDQAS